MGNGFSVVARGEYGWFGGLEGLQSEVDVYLLTDGGGDTSMMDRVADTISFFMCLHASTYVHFLALQHFKE